MPPSDPTRDHPDSEHLRAWLDTPLPPAPGAGPKRRAKLDALLGSEACTRDALLTFPRRLQTLATVAGEALAPATTAAFWFDQDVAPVRLGRGGCAVAGHVDATPLRLLWFKRPPAPLLDRLAAGPTLLSGEVRSDPRGRLICAHPRLHPDDDAGKGIALYGDLDRASSRALQALVRLLLDAWPAADAAMQPVIDAFAVLHGLQGDDVEHARRCLAALEWDAFGLELRAARAGRATQRRPVIAAGRLARALVRALPFAPTPSQEVALADLRRDLASGAIMSRVVNGDVGTGKTLVAALAVADVVEAGRQALILAPSESLADQHARTLDGWLRPLGVELGLLTGSVPQSARRPLLERLAAGTVHVVVGTHALLETGLTFHDLTLAVIDEQQRFGVRQRAQLTAKGLEVHVLALSATPIPRTLALVLHGVLEVSPLAPRPGTGDNIVTRAIGSDRLDEVQRRLVAAIEGGARAFWICPRIDDGAERAGVQARFAALNALLPGRVAQLTGRQRADARSAALAAFRDGSKPLLVATTIVEVGIDVPDASIIVIENAERFGLAQLHQLRGRVGRAGQAASCTLLHATPLGPGQHARLNLLRRCHDGLELAEADLEQRGAGRLLGLRQSGAAGFRLVDPSVDASWLAARGDRRAPLDPRVLFPAQPTVTGGLAAG